MRIGSLFSGIGGLELGLEWAGVGHTVWQVEQDAYCQQVLARHWPAAARFADVREVGAHNLPTVDVICGGFPCQDISNAGKRVGITGARSGLWSEFARIIRELRPGFVVVENVGALLVRGLDTVLGDLAAAGYDAEWDVLSAADVGAPHLRRRVFLIAWRADTEERGQRADGRASRDSGHAHELDAHVADARCVSNGANESESLARCGGAPDTGAGGQALADAAGSNSLGERLEGEREGWAAARPTHGPGNGRDSAWWSTEPDVGGALDGFSAWLDGRAINEAHKLYFAYGNASEERPGEVLRYLLSAIAPQEDRQSSGGPRFVSSTDVLLTYVRQLARIGEEGHAALASAQAEEASVRSMRADDQPPSAPRRPGPREQRPRERADVMQVLPRLLARNAEAAWVAYRRENAPFTPWADGWESGIGRVAHSVPARVDRLRALGNAVVPACAEVVGRRLLEIADCHPISFVPAAAAGSDALARQGETGGSGR